MRVLVLDENLIWLPRLKMSLTSLGHEPLELGRDG